MKAERNWFLFLCLSILEWFRVTVAEHSSQLLIFSEGTCEARLKKKTTTKNHPRSSAADQSRWIHTHTDRGSFLTSVREKQTPPPSLVFMHSQHVWTKLQENKKNNKKTHIKSANPVMKTLAVVLSWRRLTVTVRYRWRFSCKRRQHWLNLDTHYHYALSIIHWCFFTTRQLSLVQLGSATFSLHIFKYYFFIFTQSVSASRWVCVCVSVRARVCVCEQWLVHECKVSF